MDSSPRAAALQGVAIKTFNLTKRFGDFTALSACSLHIPAGRTYGLLGPNGAGKSTLLRLLLGFLHPTSGQCRIGTVATAESPIAARSQVSYLPGDARLPRQMRGKQALRYFADLHPDGDLARSLQVAETLQLDLNRYVGFMSTGMRQKLALAIVLGPQTPVLILDEPTANLDPTVRHLVLEYVEQARNDGRTVIFSSHVMSEIEQTCDRVGFLRQGKLVGELVMQDLAQRHRIAGTIGGAELGRVTQRIQAGERWLEFPETSGRILDPNNADSPLEDSPVTGASGPHPVRRRLMIQTGADLAEVLPWLLEHRVTDLRIEPVGLHTVYESVHRGDENATLFFEPVDLETEP